MANDLSRAQPRTTQQDRITRNRDAMFRRNDTDAPQRRVFADQRNAQRGDGGAAELSHILGLTQDAANSFQRYATAQHEEDERQAGGQGLIDAATGQVDEGQLQRSRAYRESVTLSRTQRSWAEGLSELNTKVQELLVNQDNPDPNARKAQVAALLEEHFHGFAVGEDGNLRDFGSPGANRWLAEQMAATRANALAVAGEKIDERLGAESVTNMTGTVRAQLLAGQDVDWNTVMGGLLPTVDPKAAMNELLTTVKDVSMTLEEDDPVRAMRILDGLLGFAARSGIQTIDPNTAAAPEAAPAENTQASYVAPFAGFGSIRLSSNMSDQRGSQPHNGEDFPMPVGTEIKAPMGGEVIGSYRNARGGNQVRIRLEDGTIVGFAHLSTRNVQVGDRVEAGQVVALSGNTGKTTGPHLHATAERNGHKVSFSEVFAGAPAAGAAHITTDPANPGVIDPQTPSEQASAAGGAFVAPPTGSIQLTAEQRVDLLEFRRTFRNRADAKAEQQRNEAQTAVASDFVARASGVGAYPTVTEVQQAIREGRVSPSQGNTLLNMMEADRNAADADVRQAEAEADHLDTESKESRVESVAGTILGPVYRGAETPTQASQRLLDIASREPDIQVRQAIMQNVTEELGRVTTLRNRSPAYRSAATNFDGWQNTYAAELAHRRLPRGMTKEAAQAAIKQQIDTWASRLGSGDVAPDKVDGWMDRAETWLDGWFDRTFPRRATATHSASQGRTRQ